MYDDHIVHNKRRHVSLPSIRADQAGKILSEINLKL